MSDFKQKETTNSLELAYQFKQNEIVKHKEIVEMLEQELQTIREQMIKMCNHQWTYEPPAIYERGYYYCSICGISK